MLPSRIYQALIMALAERPEITSIEIPIFGPLSTFLSFQFDHRNESRFDRLVIVLSEVRLDEPGHASRSRVVRV